MRPSASIIAVTLLSTAVVSPMAWGADAAKGRGLFDADCGNCHTLSAAEPAKRGPHLENLFARRYGAVEGFEYRMVWTEADPTWTPEHLSSYLQIHGRVDGTDEADLIEYLKQATTP